MYEKLDSSLNFVGREKEIIEFWKKNKIFEKSTVLRKDGEEFSFYDGPPTANGKPHIGHILTRVMKDIIPRFQTMKGKSVRRQAGWDTHGLPVELEVEKSLGFDGKGDIENYGVEPFITACKESVFKYQSEWEKMTDRVGYWVDMENPYITYDDNYIESVWWALCEIFKKGLIYKGHKVVPYCPRCGTALSSHEVAQGYKDVEELSCVVKFKVKGDFLTASENERCNRKIEVQTGDSRHFGDGSVTKSTRPNQNDERSPYQADFAVTPTYILAWTTTPWTLPSNVAVCMHPEYDYAVIEKDGERFILAKDLIGKHFTDGEYKIIETKKGKDFERLQYEPLFPYHADSDNCYFVTVDNYVTLSDGTGVVHIAPNYGEDDANVGRRYNLPFVQMVKEDGKFVSEAADFAGQFCKDADKDILKRLEQNGLLFCKIPFKHSYPFCWRCHKPLIYYARSSWFIQMSALREQLLKNNDSVNWMPDNIKAGRMGNFLENVIDWGISRERYWGTPLPLWICGDCGKVEAIGSRAELKKRGGLQTDIELHKPYVDGVVLQCGCGGKMHRTPEVVDCWFDSGAMPFAQMHYPFENQEIFSKTFPADFISEAVDQTRGWFYTLLAISTLLFNKAPFKNCIVLGHVNDKDGKKMSKHLGNVVDPWSVLDKQGADAVRWYFYTASAPWLPSRFYPEAVSEAQRKFLGTLWNVCSFYALYAEIDKFDPAKYDLKKCKLSLTDKWVLSELNSLIAFTDESLQNYKITEAAKKIEEFTDALSNWYVRRSRERFWGKEMTADKEAAYMTLFTVLETLSKVIAPFVPFIAETVHQTLVRPFIPAVPESVHFCDFPKADKKRIDKKLEADMFTVLSAANAGRSVRAGANLKNRQPLAKMYLAGKSFRTLSDELLEVLCDELNVKSVEMITDAGGFVTYDVKPQLRTLGPKYGKLLNDIRAHLTANGKAIVETVNAGKLYACEINGETIELTADDVLIAVKSKEGFASESSGELAVILDTTLTPELIEEGFYREIVSKVQNMRKESGFEVTDRIRIYYAGDAELEKVFEKFSAQIQSATLCAAFVKQSGGEETEINGKKLSVAVEKA